MRLELGIYEKRKRIKTYKTDTCDLTFGVVEDFLNVIDLDKIDNQLEIAKMALKAIPLLKPFLTDVFVGLTEEEIRKTKVSELIEVFTQILSFGFAEISNISTEKN